MNRQRNKSSSPFVFPQVPILVNEPLRPEDLAVPPVLALEDLAHEGTDQGPSGDHLPVDHHRLCSKGKDEICFIGFHAYILCLRPRGTIFPCLCISMMTDSV